MRPRATTSVPGNESVTNHVLGDRGSVKHQAVKAGLAFGFLGGLLGALEGGFKLPEFIRTVRANREGKTIMRAVTATVQHNKLLTVLVSAPLTVGAVSGIWGYFSAKASLRKNKPAERQSPETEAPQAAPMIQNDEGTPLTAANGVAWTERVAAQVTPASRRR